MVIYNRIVFLSFFIFSISVFAQKIYHEVQQKETLYGISKKYGTTIDELKKLNPTLENQNIAIFQKLVVKNKNTTNSKPVSFEKNYEQVIVKEKDTAYNLSKKNNFSNEKLTSLNPKIANGIKIGDSIKIPKEKIKKNSSPTTHLVKEKETIYGISKKYNISVKELIEINPLLKNEELKLNQVLILTKNNSKNLNATNNIHVVLMLPFNASENKVALQKISNEFLIGSKIAIDSLAKEGKKVHLKVFDTKVDENIIKSFFEEYNFEQVDAIIGPMFKKEIELVTNLLKKPIPIFSPFSNSESLLDFKNLYLTKPLEISYVERILDEIQKNYTDEPITILTTEKEQKTAFLFKNKFLEKHPESKVEVIYDLSNINPANEVLFTNSKKNILILASQDNKTTKDFINFIYNDLYLKDYKNFAPFALNYSQLFDEKIAILKKLNFIYTIHQKVNLNGIIEKNIFKKIKSTTCLENSNNLKYGYDVTFDAIDRMDALGNINSIEIPKNIFSSKFEYEKENKGYINKGVKLVKLYEF